MTADRSEGEITEARRRRPRGAVRDGLVAAALELARTGGPDAVVLREAARMVGVVPNAAYRHFADRDELLGAVCTAAMRELADRMAAGVARVRGKYGDAAAARRRPRAIGRAYLAFAREEPGLFATAFALPQQHAYGAANGGTGQDRTPLDHLRAALDELVDADVLHRRRRDGIEPHLVGGARASRARRAGTPARRPRCHPPSPRKTHPHLHRREPGMSQHAPAAQAADVDDAEGIVRRGRRQIPPGRAPAACGCALRAIGEPGHHPPPGLPLCGK